ncbi:multiple cyclophane-containing RiPP AmcA [Streptomyces sp. MS19]
MELVATRHVAPPATAGAAWDNGAKSPAPFDNRPTWDNWNKKK